MKRHQDAQRLFDPYRVSMSRHTLTSPFLTLSAAIALIFSLSAPGMVRAANDQSTALRTLDTQSPVTYFISAGSKQTRNLPGDRELARWALEAWQRSAGGKLRFQAAPEASALIRLYWVEPNGGNYGEMQPLVVDGRPGAALYIQPDIESLGPDIARATQPDPLLRDSIVYLTCLHELGHALGLEHTRDFRDIMYYFGYGGEVVEYFQRYRAQIHSRNDIASIAGLSGADLSRIRAIYGRRQ